jgi:hypothetical protein
MIDASKLPGVSPEARQAELDADAPPAEPVEYTRAPDGPSHAASIRQPVTQRGGQ